MRVGTTSSGLKKQYGRTAYSKHASGNKQLHRIEQAQLLAEKRKSISIQIDWKDEEWGHPILMDAYRFLYDFESWSSLIYNWFIMGIVLWWLVIFLISSVHPFYTPGNPHDYWWAMDTAIVAVLSVDALLSLLLKPVKRWKWWLISSEFFCVLGLLPYYIDLNSSVGNQINWLSCLRCFWFFRIFLLIKPLRPIRAAYIQTMSLMGINSGIIMILVFTIISNIIFAGLIWIAETHYCDFYQDCDDDDGCWKYNGSPDIYGANGETYFQSIPAALWWAVVTQFTIGFGDTYPITPAGKVVACIYFFVSLLMLAYPLAYVANAFKNAYNNESPVVQVNRNIPSHLPKGRALIEKIDRLSLYLEKIREHSDQGIEKLDHTIGTLRLLTNRLNKTPYLINQQLHDVHEELLRRDIYIRDPIEHAEKVEITPSRNDLAPINQQRFLHRDSDSDSTSNIDN